jgi:hypothetical protein
MVAHGVREEIVGGYGAVVDDPLADAQVPEEIGVADRSCGWHDCDQKDGADEELGQSDAAEPASTRTGRGAH